MEQLFGPSISLVETSYRLTNTPSCPISSAFVRQIVSPLPLENDFQETPFLEKD